MYEYRVKEIVSIYDGDTMKVIVDAGFGIYTLQTLRLYGIDTPEVRGEEREDGLVSRDWLREKVYTAMQEDGPGITIKTYKDKTGKYGRLLAEVYVNGVETSLNEQLIQEGLAEEYMKG